ncbi:MAG: hypothetical protein K2Y51_12885 [Gammaproteobacteria bacterium]|nr:hypothetical protein [Gammaproteobacteria bacterium]
MLPPSKHRPLSAFRVAVRAWVALCLLCGLTGMVSAGTYDQSTVAFNWIDPGTHTTVTWTSGKSCTAYANAPADDDITAPLPIGFNFRYGTTTYTTVQVMLNGRLQFNNNYCGHGTQTVGPPPTYPFGYPNANMNNTMRIYGADLDMSSGPSCPPASCFVRYTATPIGTAPNRQFVVTWRNVREWNFSSSSFDMQIILNEDGSFVFQYLSIKNSSGGKAQVGWQLTTTDFEVTRNGPPSDKTAFRYSVPTSAPSGLAVTASSAVASTCSPTTVTLTALDAAGKTVPSYAGTVLLTTSTGRGDWAISSATGTLVMGTANSGSATYTFNGSGSGRDNGTATLRLSNVHADVLTVTGADAAVKGLSATSSAITFLTNAFVVTPTDVLGTTAVAGRGHAFRAEFWRQDPSSGACGIATGYTGARPLDAWVTRDASDPGGAAPTVGGSALPNAPSGGMGSNNLSLTFTAGTATFTLATSDVGKYALNLRDDSRSFASGADVAGASGTLTVRPFALSVESVSAGTTTNPAASTASGALFTSAGSNFSATVRAVLWQAADDPSNSGTPTGGANLLDNTVAASYAWPTTVAAAAPFTPATGVLGTLNNGAILQSAFSGGRRTVSNLQYTEVGSVSLAASAATYLNTAGVSLSSPAVVVGRFRPAAFAVAYNTPAFNTGCAGGGFTYVGAPFTYRTAPVITVTAQNALGGTTRNYTGSFWKLTNASLTGKAYSALSGTLNTAALPATDPVIVDAGNGVGTLTFSTGPTGIAFDRGAPSAPFNAEIALAINVIDGDGVAFASNPARFGAATAGNGIAFNDGSALTANDKQMLWGRLRLVSGFGSELLPVALQVRAETLTAAGAYVTNTADNCTALPGAAMTLANNLETKAAGVNSIRITAAASSSATIAGATVANGASTVTFSAPGAGNTGFAGFNYDLASAAATWLRFDWAGTGSNDQNPSARADFGIFGGPRTVIYVREPW